MVMVFGGILVATLAAGCFGGGRGYSNNSTATIAATAATETPIRTVVTTMDIRVRKVMGIHTVPAIKTEYELTRIGIAIKTAISRRAWITTGILARILSPAVALRKTDRLEHVYLATN